MDPIAQLGRDAYHALCIAFAAQSKDKLYAPETDVLLEEARELLGVSEEEDGAIRKEIEKDPMIAALRRGEMPPGGLRSLAGPSSRMATPFAGGMPPPGGAAGAGFETPFSNTSVQQKVPAKKTTTTPASGSAAAAAGAVATTGGASSLVGRRLKRLFPDLSPPWVTGTIVQYNPANGKHLIQYGPPLKREMWDNVEDFAPQNFQWLEAGAEPPATVAAKPGPLTKTGGSKSSAKPSTSKPPQPLQPVVKAQPAITAPHMLLPVGHSSFHATGVSLTAAPYNDGFLRASIAKNRPEDLFTMLTSIDDREAGVVRELLALLDDPGDVADITRLLEESQALGQREQQLRAELRELGVAG